MIILKFILGLVIIIGIIVCGLILLAGCCWLSSIIDKKTKDTVIEKILNFIGKIIYYTFWIFIVGMFVIIIISAAVNIGGSILR
jgi:biotin transporter BioY